MYPKREGAIVVIDFARESTYQSVPIYTVADLVLKSLYNSSLELMDRRSLIYVGYRVRNVKNQVLKLNSLLLWLVTCVKPLLEPP